MELDQTLTEEKEQINNNFGTLFNVEDVYKTYEKRSLSQREKDLLNLRDSFHKQYGYAKINPIVKDTHYSYTIDSSKVINYMRIIYTRKSEIPIAHLVQTLIIYYNVNFKEVMQAIHVALDRELLEFITPGTLKLLR